MALLQDGFYFLCLYVVILSLGLVQTTSSLPHGHEARRTRPPWVECTTSDTDLAIQSLTPSRHDGRCPPPPDQIPDDACSQCGCRSDRACPIEQKCCFNGCQYTCMNPVKPPPAFDWLNEPIRQRTSGNAWLITGPEKTHTVESCSTSTFDEGDGILLECPTGYQCYITYGGDSENNIPNKGICIKIK